MVPEKVIYMPLEDLLSFLLSETKAHMKENDGLA